LLLSINVSAAGSGSIFTTRSDCGSAIQDANHYAVGEHVYTHTQGFDPGTYAWSITGNPGGSSADPSIVVASGTVVIDSSGIACINGYRVQPDDRGEYKVAVGNKFDNYRVDGLESNKTASTTFTRTYDWDITKSASDDALDLFSGDGSTVTYTIDVTKSIESDVYTVEGDIILHNNEVYSTTGLTAIDCIQIDDGNGWEDLSCTTVDTGVIVVANGTVNIPYSFTVTPQDGASYRNKAIIILDGYEVADGAAEVYAPFSFPTTPTSEVNAQATVTDSNGMEWSFSDSGSETYDTTFTCANAGVNTNTVALTSEALEKSASADVAVTCYDLAVEKTASTSLTRTSAWTVSKTASASNLTLATGEAYDVTYTVTVGTSTTDSDWAAAGAITVHNPAPIDATLNSVSDATDDAIVGAVDCDVEFPYVLAAGADLVCAYTMDLTSAAARTNTASATLQNHQDDAAQGTTDFSGDAAISFAQADVTLVDEEAVVTDSLQGTLGTVSGAQTFTYTRTIIQSVCGEYVVSNTATVTGSDTGAQASSAWDVAVHVPCNNGCTLTQGYWKTHTEASKHYDDTWASVGGSNAAFFLSGKTYAQVMTTPPAGNAYYQLAHQYIAAKLNSQNGATLPPNVQTAFNSATSLLSSTTPTQAAGLKGGAKNTWTTLAGTLASFNEGTTGPGHCSE
jgi:hypothetical protein